MFLLVNKKHSRKYLLSVLFIFLNSIFIACTQASIQTLPSITPQAAMVTDPVLPKFSSYSQVQEKKAAFFGFILNFVNHENTRISGLRTALKALQSKAGELTPVEQQWLQQLAVHYRANKKDVTDKKLIKKLLRRVDVIPASLALVQAANESAWGTSRFARKGNNLFGQWCFKKGCGIVPKSRTSGAHHEVAKFPSARQSVESYMHNLNSHRAYAELRKIRAQLRGQQKTVSGKALAGGLINYSGRREAYVKELRQMIRYNKLAKYDAIKD